MTEARAFTAWLLQQGSRRDRVGQLAREVVSGNVRPARRATVEAWESAVADADASFGCLSGVARALAEWRAL